MHELLTIVMDSSWLTSGTPVNRRYNSYISWHDGAIKWKHFPHNWPFVREIHRSPVNSPHKRPMTRSFDVFFDLNKRLSKQSWGWWFETLARPLWRHCNDVTITEPINFHILICTHTLDMETLSALPFHCERNPSVTGHIPTIHLRIEGASNERWYASFHQPPESLYKVCLVQQQKSSLHCITSPSWGESISDRSCSCLWAIYWDQVLSGEWSCSWSSADRRCSNYIWVINNFIAYLSASYIRDLTVIFTSEFTKCATKYSAISKSSK